MAKTAQTTPQRDARQLFQEVKARADLALYIQKATGIQGKRSGNQLVFNGCPFCGHNDCFSLKGPEFDKYKCFSCGEGGDIFTFAEKRLGFEKKGAQLRDVADFAGVQLPEQERETVKPGPRPVDLTRQKILEAAIAHYRAVLAGRKDLMEWLTAPKPDGRGHLQRTIERMELGASDGKLMEALQAQGFELEALQASGLLAEVKDRPGEWRDFFTPGLVIFPHRLPGGEVAHFTIKDPRKRIDYQLKTEHRTPGFAWGNQKAIRGEHIVLVEGENDLASFLDAEVHHVMASLGSVSEEQLRYLDTNGHGKRFTLFFDYDTKPGANGQPPAGIRYTRKVYQRLLRNRACQVFVGSALMEPGEDPDDWIQKDMETAKARIQGALKKAHNPLLWELKVMPAEVRADADAALRHLEEIAFFETLSLLPELQRDAVVVELQKLGFSRDSVLNSIKQGYDLREQLNTLLEDFNNATRSDSYRRLVGTAVWEYFKTRGKFFVSGDKLHLFYHQVIYQISDNTAFKALMHREAGINYKQDIAGFVWEELKALCYNRGDRLTEFGWISLLDDQGQPALYLNLKDPANRVLQIRAGAAELVENGTNAHNVLLAESTRMKPFKFDAEVNIAAAMRDMKALVLDTLTCEPAQRYMVLSWALAAYLLPFCESRGLLKMEGMSQSGKTTAAKFLSLLVYGDNVVGKSTTASDYSMAATEPLIIKDNLETDDINRNVLNFLLLAATGATNYKRAHGTESGTMGEKINCMVAITAIEPFAKPELINRTFIVDFAKRWQRHDFVESEAVGRLTARRDDILSAWVRILAEEVLPSLGDRGAIIKYIKEQHRDYAKERVTEFTALMTLISRALAKYMPLPADIRAAGGDRPAEYVLLDAWVRYQNEHSRAIEVGTNAVLQLLDGLRRIFMIDFSRKAGPADDSVMCELMGLQVYRQSLTDAEGKFTGSQRYWFEASTADLLAMMNRYGRDYGVKVPFTNAKQLGVRISNEMDTLDSAGWQQRQVKVIHGNRITRWQWSDLPDAPEPEDENAQHRSDPAKRREARTAPKAQSR